MLVSELQQRLASVKEAAIETHLSQLRVDDDAAKLFVLGEGGAVSKEFYLDERVERGLSRYLGIPKAYLDKCDAEAKAWNLNHWFARKASASAVIETVGDQFVTIHKSGLVIIPLSKIIDIIGDKLSPTYEVVNFIREDNRFQIDVITPHSVIVEPWEELEDRNPAHHADGNVGDITHGGIRFRANPTEVEAPLVQTYLQRKWCKNGATSPVKEGTIKIKAQTVDGIISEISAAMENAIGDLDNKLASYAALANRFPPGGTLAFARQLGTEYKIPAKVLNKILDRIQILPDGASLYDVLNVFTAMANEEGIAYATIVKLQELGGSLAFDTDAVTHRCGACERLLP